ncbi:methyltransferase family protein [Demequina sp.]|uniref:methyltransferase family protein n=1 Tax=Demequina sp. TaxID=2050685 RepID=UPI003D0AB107
MTTGRVLVGVQGLLFLAVAVTAFVPGPTLFASLILGLALVVAGSVVVVWTGRVLGRSLTPLPEPNGAGMVAAGPYRWARHPMYSALVVICLGVAVGVGVVWCYLAVACLCVFFAVKARVEEGYLLGAYPGYGAYGARVGRFVPGLGRLSTV